MSSKTKLKAIHRLSNLADAGADHPDAMSFGPDRDYFDHRLILSTISGDHAEATRLHREFVEDEVISAPRQTSRRQPDGSRRSLQVQRLSAERLLVQLGRMSNGRIDPQLIAVACSNCPHDGPGEAWYDFEHQIRVDERRAELERRLGLTGADREVA
jgi:hypothetical protein